jgi:hypothetical protein
MAVPLLAGLFGCSTFGGGGPLATPPATTSALSDCDERKSAEDNLRRLLVKIAAELPGAGLQPLQGTGIVLGRDGGKVHIATAWHVVNSTDVARPLKITSSQNGRPPVEARQIAGFKAEDIAVVEITEPAGFEWPDLAVLSDVPDSRINQLAVIGYPSGGGFNRSELSGTSFTSEEFHLGAPVSQGYSGGGAFDAHLRLAAIMQTNTDRYAIALPISAVIKLVKQSKKPIALDLAVAPPSKPRIRLLGVGDERSELTQGFEDVTRHALASAGLEAKCNRSNAYGLSLTLKQWRRSGTQSVVTVRGRLDMLDDEFTEMEPDDIEFGLLSSTENRKDVEARARDWAPKFLAKLQKRLEDRASKRGT